MDLWLFWAIAAALTAMVALVMVQALRRGGDRHGEHTDLKVYRDQLAEVDRDLARGTLSEEEGQRLRVEVSRRLLEADRSLASQAAPTARGSLIWAGVLVIAVLGGALWVYDRMGAPGYADLPLASRLAAAAGLGHGAATQRQSFQGRYGMKRTLAATDWTPAGLPPGALLFVRRLRTTGKSNTELTKCMGSASCLLATSLAQ